MARKRQDAVPRVACDMLHYAMMKSDDKKKTEYETPVYMENVATVGFKPNSSMSTWYGDDGPRGSTALIGEPDVAINIADIIPFDFAALTGATYKDGGVAFGNPMPPDVAVLWRSQKDNGHYRYLRVYKVKFMLPDIDSTGKEASISYQKQTINGKGALRLSDDMAVYFLDTDSPDLPDGVTKEVIETEWFKDVNFTPDKHTGGASG